MDNKKSIYFQTWYDRVKDWIQRIARYSGLEFVITCVLAGFLVILVVGYLMSEIVRSVYGWKVFFLLVVIVMLAIVLSLRLIRQRQSQREQAGILKETCDVCLENEQLMLFTIRRSDEKVVRFTNRLNGSQGADGTSKSPQTLPELCSIMQLDTLESRRLMRHIAEFKGDQSERMYLHYNSYSLLRVVLRNSTNPRGYLIGCAVDCTQETANIEHQQEEVIQMEKMQDKALLIVKLDISMNRWMIENGRNEEFLKRLGMPVGNWRMFAPDLNALLKKFIYPEDYELFARCMIPEHIMDMYTNMRYRESVDYRIRTSVSAVYSWHRQEMHVYRDPESGSIIARMYIVNNDGEKKAEMERSLRRQVEKDAGTALSGMFYGLYYVHYTDLLCYTVKRIQDKTISPVMVQPLAKIFGRFIEERVHPDDREVFRKMVDPYWISKLIGTSESIYVRKPIRIACGDGMYIPVQMILQPAKYENDSLQEFVLAFQKPDASFEIGGLDE